MNEAMFNQVVQIGIVVRDAEATARRYRDLLSLDDWRFNEVDTVNGKGMTSVPMPSPGMTAMFNLVIT